MVDRTDIVDEAITFFRANVFFRNFDIKSPADKLLIYLTFYINVALKKLEGCRTLAEGTKAIINLGLENVPVPGESGFPFPGLFPLPQSHKEAGTYSFTLLLSCLDMLSLFSDLMLLCVMLYCIISCILLSSFNCLRTCIYFIQFLTDGFDGIFTFATLIYFIEKWSLLRRIYTKKEEEEFIKIGDFTHQVLANHTLGSGWLLFGRVT